MSYTHLAFLIRYFLYLHFKCYHLSWFPLPPRPPPAKPTPHNPPPTHGIPPTDARQGHPLVHIHLEAWVPPCALFGWWFSSWEFWGTGWLILLFFLGDVNTFRTFSPFSSSSIGNHRAPHFVC